MNRKVFFNIAVALILTAAFASCKKDKETYTVTFNSGEGSAVPAQTVSEGEKAKKPTPDPTRTGHTFAAWYKEATHATEWKFDTDVVTSNITLYAKWTQNTYTVTFNSNGGSEIAEQTVVGGGKATKPADPINHVLFFGGWIKPDLTPFDFDTPIIENITLTAKWINPFVGKWTNIGNLGTWSPETTIIMGETEWHDSTELYYIISWTSCSNGSTATKDDYPKGYHVVFGLEWNIYVYLHKTDPNKMLLYVDNDGGSNYEIFTRQN